MDSGKFDWSSNSLFKTLNEPYKGFHDMKFVDEFGPSAFINRARKEGARDFGACMSPHTAFLILQGLETLSLRMDRHISNTRQIVDFLSSHEEVKSVSYPELSNHHRMDKAALSKAGITENTVRLSVGIEDIEDLKEDLQEALKQANR